MVLAKQHNLDDHMLLVTPWNLQAGELAKQHGVRCVAFWHVLAGVDSRGSCAHALLDLSRYTCEVVDEMLLLSHRQLVMLRALMRRHPTVAFYAPGDPLPAARHRRPHRPCHQYTNCTADFLNEAFAAHHPVTELRCHQTFSHQKMKQVPCGALLRILSKAPDGSTTTLELKSGDYLELDAEAAAKHFKLPFISTTHSAQGITVEEPYLLAADWKLHYADARWFYTAIMRLRCLSGIPLLHGGGKGSLLLLHRWAMLEHQREHRAKQLCAGTPPPGRERGPPARACPVSPGFVDPRRRPRA